MISSIVSRLVILLFGTLYPAYASYKAVRTKNVKEYVKWMMYWIVFALFTCAETFTDVFLSFWFPFYYEIKIILVLWLLSPATKGSSILYRKFVHPMLSRREQDIDEYIAKAKEQGYHTVLHLGSKGVNYATTVIMQTAIKGGGGLVQQLRRSYSLSDLSTDKDMADVNRNSKALSNIPDDEMDEADDGSMDPRLLRPRGYSPRRSASGSGRVEMYFPEVDVDVRQHGSRQREPSIPLSHIRSSEDVSSGYSSAEPLYAGHPAKAEGLVSSREPLVRTASVGSTRSMRPKSSRGGAVAKRAPTAEDSDGWHGDEAEFQSQEEFLFNVSSSIPSQLASIPQTLSQDELILLLQQLQAGMTSNSQQNLQLHVDTTNISNESEFALPQTSKTDSESATMQKIKQTFTSVVENQSTDISTEALQESSTTPELKQISTSVIENQNTNILTEALQESTTPKLKLTSRSVVENQNTSILTDVVQRCTTHHESDQTPASVVENDISTGSLEESTAPELKQTSTSFIENQNTNISTEVLQESGTTSELKQTSTSVAENQNTTISSEVLQASATTPELQQTSTSVAENEKSNISSDVDQGSATNHEFNQTSTINANVEKHSMDGSPEVLQESTIPAENEAHLDDSFVDANSETKIESPSDSTLLAENGIEGQDSSSEANKDDFVSTENLALPYTDDQNSTCESKKVPSSQESNESAEKKDIRSGRYHKLHAPTPPSKLPDIDVVESSSIIQPHKFTSSSKDKKKTKQKGSTFSRLFGMPKTQLGHFASMLPFWSNKDTRAHSAESVSSEEDRSPLPPSRFRAVPMSSCSLEYLPCTAESAFNRDKSNSISDFKVREMSHSPPSVRRRN